MNKLLRLVLLLGVGCALSIVLAQTSSEQIEADYANSVKPFLTDADGFSLYLFTDDSDAQSSCVDSCAEAWPPVLVETQAAGGEGVAAEMLGTFTRADGSVQVTYNGHPLYRFAQDQRPGDTNGEGVGGKWYLVSPYGVAATPDTTQPATQTQEVNPMGETATPSAEALVRTGEGVFTSNCAVCHGTQGEGGTGPVLADSTTLEDTELILSQVIRGGRVMPPFGDELTDAQIAAVATYIRSSWGNDFGAITAQDVSANR